MWAPVDVVASEFMWSLVSMLDTFWPWERTYNTKEDDIPLLQPLYIDLKKIDQKTPFFEKTNRVKSFFLHFWLEKKLL